ncbi:alpha/beta hydrolase family protein [Streptomyces sp. NPDC001700]
MQRHGFLPSPPVTYASAGFAAVAPDYLGMGTGPGLHPWMDVPSETTASLDMLRAARAVVPLERKVAVTGFSQGASAALGLARSLQAGEDRWFRLGALAPVSGAYDFGGTERRALLGGELDATSSAIYVAYTLVAFNRLHEVYDRPERVFQGDARHIESLFDGEHTGLEIKNGIPGTVKDLLTDEGMRLLEHPTGEFAAALRTASRVCTGWAPRVPARLYLADGDQEAAVGNTAVCRAELRRRGADVPVVDVGPVDYQGSRHLGSNVAATASIVRWLSDLP